MHPVLRVVAPNRYLLPINFSVADIADPDCVSVCFGHGFVSTSPAFNSSSASQPAGPLGRPAPPKNGRNGPPLWGAGGVGTICAVLSSNSPITCMLYPLDLLKAFDCLNHSLFLNKLSHYEISGCSNGLFCSYLSNRLQLVDFNGQLSTELPISTSVPQGSVLRPLLFLIYIYICINDLPLVSNILPC